ncbi:MAG: molecular chaperone HtpG [Clostridia bacterium]|nr:molecular chaperone HtpG [Clostridia bacterium]
MSKKQFKTESKKLLDMMINSIYTHKEIFLRELISNASDAIDKLYFRSLTDSSVTLSRGDYEIRIVPDAATRTLEIRDNGIGMTKDELENNLGTIARSGSFEFKRADNTSAEGPGADAKANPDIDIIGQFGVGFYSSFMVSDLVTVESRAWGADEAYMWRSSGTDGYTVEPCDKADAGTVVTLHLKPDGEDENYSEFLDEWKLKELVKKYSDYIRYPIRMEVTKSRKKADSPEDKPEYESYREDETLNTMVPIWKRPQDQVTDEEYADFYRNKFYDYEAPLKVIRQKTEGMSSFEALLFIPARAPFDYYSREFEKGLQLYSSGVMIMEKCKELIPDYFSFVRGLVDSADLSLNISREMLQHDRQLKVIGRAVEKKIASELAKMQENDREKYEQFFKAFGRQLKYGLYMDYGAHKDVLQDLLLFRSSYEAPAADNAAAEEKDAESADSKPAYVPQLTTLKEYVARMKEDQKKIYYAAGESVNRIKLLPQVEAVLAHGFEVLYLTEDVDEFALQMLRTYADKEFLNVQRDELDIATDEEKENVKQANEQSADLLGFMKETLGDAVNAVRFTNTLQKHPVSLSSEGALSMGMEKTLSQMPGAEDGGMKAQLVLEINLDHPLAARLRELYGADNDKLARYTHILYAQARLISGLSLDNAAEIGDMVADLML